jgi:esterase/lipase superfamily enzyme
MKNAWLGAVTLCIGSGLLAAGLFVGCKSEADSTSVAPPRPQPSSAYEPPRGEQPREWSLDPAVVDESTADDAWRRSQYSPVSEQPPQENAPPITPPSYSHAAPELPGPAAEAPAYDPALDAVGSGRRSVGAPQVTTVQPSAGDENPLRVADAPPEPAAEENPFRSSSAFAPRSFAPSARTFSAAPPPAPAGGSAPPSVEGNVEPAPPEPRSMGTFSAMRSADEEQPLQPGAAAPEESYSSDVAQGFAASEAIAPPSSAAARAMGSDVDAMPPPGSASAAMAVNPNYDVVRVFYGTDRQAWQPAADTWSDIGLRFWPTLAAVAAVVLFGLVALLWRSGALALLTLASVGIAVGLGYQATSTTLERARIAEKEGVRYLAERSISGEVQMGICEVTIPKTHDPGELESPSVLRLEFREDKSKHVVLSKTERLEGDEFFTALRDRVQESPGKELFVFVHGFNVQFEDAARRTAQMAYDLKYQGAPVFFSWPANDKFLLTYSQDETNVSWAAPHLKRFLLEVARNSDAKAINVIAHSMGNRALTAALREIELELRDEARLFNQVVLAAPDIDADDFRQNIAPFIQKTSRRITLYASSNDQALAASQLVHRYPRAGDSGQVLVVVPGIETIDVSAIEGGPWGHSYYASSDPILKDLAVLFSAAEEQSLQRSWLMAQQRDGVNYWVFQAQSASARATTDGGLR